MDILCDLNGPQREAVTCIDRPLLVLAGAGSGKTRVITSRVAYMIQQGISPGSILAITFTNKAAEEMRRRVAELQAPPGATVCTFHSLCARLLRRFAAEANISANFTIYDRDDQIKLVKAAMGGLNLPVGNLSPGKVHATISKTKNALKTPEAYAKEAGDFYAGNVAEIYREYEKLLAANNALDFDDLLLRIVFLMRDCPEVRELLGSTYRHVLVDEYQDTNRAQYILAHGIALDHENICVTGDPDQSIYAWRGADISNILEFEADYPNARVIRLEENYRSTKPILAAASRLISRNRMRKRKELWTRRVGGDDVRALLCDNEHAEAREITRRITSWVSEGREYKDIAIFYRVNSLSRVIEEALIVAGIPYRIARGVEFYNRKEIKDVLAYLKLMVNPADDLSCRRIINTPARGIGDVTVKRLEALAAATGQSLLGACGRAGEAGLSAGAAKKVNAFAELISSLSGRTDRPVRDIVEDVVVKAGLEEAHSRSDEDGRQAAANIGELISTAAQFDQAGQGATLTDYLQQVSLVSDADHFKGSGGAVSLMTLHAAKGLEFPVVFIVGCEEGLLPFHRGEPNAGWDAGKVEDMEEERRLAFVGMTRSKEQLLLTSARRRMVRGRTVSQVASPFLGEIDGENMTTEDLTTPQEAPSTRRQAGGFYADVAERELIEAMDETPLPPEYEYLRAGSRVRHCRFGEGKVTRISSQPWPNTTAKIIFDDHGPKTIMLSRTTLELL